MNWTAEAQWWELLDELHASPVAIALVAAGGGSGAIGRCFQRQGASRTFVEAVIPYSRTAMAEYLGDSPPHASASSATARQLAAVARGRAERLRDQDRNNLRPAGIALVAALPTEPPRRGDDRIHVAVDSIDGLNHWSLHLAGHSCTRSSAERISDEMMFLALATMAKKTDADRFFRDSGLAFESTA